MFRSLNAFRDEDLRADRQPEFTQIDVEMAFATEEAIYSLTEGLMAALWDEVLGIKLRYPLSATDLPKCTLEIWL